jgi:hypothetical protein
MGIPLALDTFVGIIIAIAFSAVCFQISLFLCRFGQDCQRQRGKEDLRFQIDEGPRAVRDLLRRADGGGPEQQTRSPRALWRWNGNVQTMPDMRSSGGGPNQRAGSACACHECLPQGAVRHAGRNRRALKRARRWYRRSTRAVPSQCNGVFLHTINRRPRRRGIALQDMELTLHTSQWVHIEGVIDLQRHPSLFSFSPIFGAV